MKRLMVILLVAVGVTLVFDVLYAAVSQAGARAASCSDSYPADGTGGPRYVGSNQSLHGNTLQITCPDSSTFWDVQYKVSKTASGGTYFYPIDVERTGHGSALFSISVSPIGCNQGWFYQTFVHNHITGGNISKPSQSIGLVIC